MARDIPQQKHTHSKLPRLPKSQNQESPPNYPQILIATDARIQKRPLLHPAIPSPYTNSTHEKVVYISTKTPFVSAVKRIRKLLSHIDKRSTKNVDLLNGKSSDKANVQALSKREKEPEEVHVRATGKAIEKALGLALYFQGQDDLRVRLKTGTVGTVDDIVQEEGDREDGGEDNGDEEELPESRVRMASTLEVAVSLR